MILADIELSRRVEGAEARLSSAIGEAAVRYDPEARAFVAQLGSGVAVFAGPDSPSNKIIGAGFEAPPDEGRLDEIERLYFDRAGAVQAEVATLALPEAHAAFTARGYLLQGFENVLGRLLTDEDALAGDDGTIGLELVPPDRIAAWMEVVITGFEHPDATGAGSGVAPPPRHAVERAFAQISRAPGFLTYLARIDGDAAGGGALRIDEGVAQLCGASTLPPHRRRGVQSALLRRRLADARRAGCDLAVMTAQPGSKSHFNAQRQGFSLLYTRAILVKVPPRSRTRRSSFPC